MRANFPRYGYIDQVEAQRAMLEVMGVDHLKLVAGVSQGGMQTWLWGERFPDAMDALVPVAAMPMQISSGPRNDSRCSARSSSGPSIDDPEARRRYDPARPPTRWANTAASLAAMMAGDPARLQEAGPDRTMTLAFCDRLAAVSWSRCDCLLHAFRSSADYDPAPAIDRIEAPLLAINFADDEVIPIGLTVTRETVARLSSGRLMVLPGGYGHLGIFHGELWAEPLGSFLNSLPARA